MTRRHPHRAEIASRAARLAAVEAELISASGLKADGLTPEQKVRFQHGALMMMASEVQKARLLSGQPCDMNLLLACDAALRGLLPAAPIKVDCSYAYICVKCQEQISVEEHDRIEREQAAKAKALPAPQRLIEHKRDEEKRRPASVHDNPLAPVREIDRWLPWTGANK